MPSFKELFGEFLSSEQNDVFSSAEIENCKLDNEFRALLAEIFSDKYISSSEVSSAADYIKKALNLSSCHFNLKFSETALNDTACVDLANEIRVKNAVLSGYFNGAEYKLDDDTVHITLKYGGIKHIKDSNFEKSFQNLANTKFSRNLLFFLVVLILVVYF